MIKRLILTTSPPTSPFNYHAVGHTVFALGRFLTAVLGIFIKPRRILLVLYIGCIVTAALATHLDKASGTAMNVLIQLFESGIFSLIFALSLRGLGSFTKWGAVLLTAATSGGALVPAVMSPVVLSRGVQYGFIVVVATFAFGIVMPVYLALVPAAKKQVDPGRMGVSDEPESLSPSPTTSEMQERKGNRTNRVLHSFARKGRNLGSFTTASTDRPSIEHVEAAHSKASGRQQNGSGMDLAPWPD